MALSISGGGNRHKRSASCPAKPLDNPFSQTYRLCFTQTVLHRIAVKIDGVAQRLDDIP